MAETYQLPDTYATPPRTRCRNARAVTSETGVASVGCVHTFSVRWWFVLLILAAFVIAMRRSLGRWMELFVIDVKDGRALLRRGRLPHDLFADIADVVERPPLADVTIVVRKDAGVARIVVRGNVSEGRLQQLRNVVGRYPLAKIQAGGKTR